MAVDEYERDDEHGPVSLEASEDVRWVVGDSTPLPLLPERDRLWDHFQLEEVDQQDHLAVQLYSALLEGQDETGDGLKLSKNMILEMAHLKMTGKIT